MAPAIHHVQVCMPEGREADARAFYGDLLGMEELTKPDTLAGRGGCWFRSSTIDLHLGVERPFVPATKAHVAYLVTDLDAIRAALEGSGYPVTADDLFPGYERVFTADPFGNRVEILRALT